MGMRLTVVKNGSELKVVDLDELNKDSILLGRGADADIRLDDRAVGRNHAVIRLVANSGGYFIQKQTEFGKLKLNGADINESPLSPGDVIAIADYKVSLMKKVESQGQENTNPMDEFGQATSEPSPDNFSAQPQEEIPFDMPMPEPAPAPQAATLSLPVEEQQGMAETSSEFKARPEATLTGSENPQMSLGDEGTAIISRGHVSVSLQFKPGEANTENFEIKEAEISLGRGSDCHIVLADKKSSRKHAIIKKIGTSYVVQDLDSANGTFINGVRIKEQELASDDAIKIGSTEFIFKSINKDYFKEEQKGNFLQVKNEEILEPGTASISSLNSAFAPPTLDQRIPITTNPAVAASPMEFVPVESLNQKPGLQGEPQGFVNKLIISYRELPQQKKIRYLIMLAVLAVLGSFSDEVTTTKPAKSPQQQSNDPKMAEFYRLNKDQQKFVEQTYQVAMDYYTNQKYENAIYESDKILTILKNGYKDIADIKDYAKQGLETLKAQTEAEERKKADEERKKKIAELGVQAQELYKEGKIAETKEIFGQILELDPDNPIVAQIKAAIEEEEHKQQIEEEKRQQLEHMKMLMSQVIQDGKELLEKGQYYQAIDKFLEVPGVGTDPDLLSEAKTLIETARTQLLEKRKPFLEEAQRFYTNKEYDKARQAYLDALAIDQLCEECKEGLNRIKQDVHARSQRHFIEAIIAESVSDLDTARQKYLDCFKSSVPEDDYYGRCWRKYYRFITMESNKNEAEGEVPPPPQDFFKDDPITEEVLKFL